MPTNDQLECSDEERRALLADSGLDGIDAVEVPFDDQTHLRVYFITGPPPSVGAGDVSVTGGVRIRNIDVVATQVLVDVTGESYLEVTVDQAGDFSEYTLHIDAGGVLDPGYDHKPFGFKVGCPRDFDCRDEPECPPDEVEAPVIDYMAKDYAGFRRLLLDLVPSTIPEWTDRHAADLGMTLVELLAYEGDYLSYKQDAAAQEMHLETARQRESVARHVRLIDYPMHQGINAKAFVHLTVDGPPGTIPARSLRCPERTPRFLTRVGTPVNPQTTLPPGPEVDAADAERAVAAADAVFEPVEATTVDPALNEIRIHTWGDQACCLPIGATSVDLVGDVPLFEGDLLLLEEVLGVATGLAQDADPRHRQVVRIVERNQEDGGLPIEDPLFTLGPDGEVRPADAGDPPLQLTRVTWDIEDALTFPLCVSATDANGQPLPEVAVARGNIVLVDHGATARETHDPDERRIRYSRIGYRFRLRQAPLTFGFARDYRSGGPVARLDDLSPRDAEPHIVIVDGDGSGLTWLPEPDLLNSDPFSRSFVAEPDHAGRALLRFGDGRFGRVPSFPSGSDEAEEHRLHAIFRIGNGRAGNVGRDTIVHVAAPQQPPGDWPAITGVRNPLAAWGGVDPEPIDLVKQIAPDAFRAETYRAVTESDYAAAAGLLPVVSRAQADFRWTGSWHTVFVTVDPRATDELTHGIETEVRSHLTRYKLAGYDLEIDPPRYVSLEIEMIVCAGADHFRPDVHDAVRRALSSRVLPDRTRGFFHPDNFTFGQPLHLSEVYAAVEAVPGVDSVEVVVFQRYGEPAAGELAVGRIEAGRLEILRLDNDPNFPEHGVLRIEMRGGK